MPLQNRMLPTGQIVAMALRGAWMGNRGNLHDADGRIGTSRWKTKGWVCCRPSFKNRRRTLMAPGRYTELFFYDDAVALAAGHRPCFECRRAKAAEFRTKWHDVFGGSALLADIDRILHRARVDPKSRAQIRHRADAGGLPPDTFILHHDTPFRITHTGVIPMTRGGYGPASAAPAGPVTVLTPRPIVALMQAGYRPEMDVPMAHVTPR